MLALFSTAFACPGSYSIIHAGATMNIEFTNSCAEVAEEIEARANAHADGAMWQDPHNHGTYTLLKSSATYIETKRVTKNRVFEDKQDFKLTPKGTGCAVEACSESQGLSAADKGTNFCDMFDLFCNKEDCSDGNCCAVLKNNLQYTIESKNCYPFFFNCPEGRAAELATCLKMPSTEEELAEYRANAIHLQRMGAFDTQE